MSASWVHRRTGLQRANAFVLVCLVPLCGMILLHSLEEAPGQQGHAKHGRRRLGRRSSDKVELSDNDLYAWIYAVGTKGTILRSQPPALGLDEKGAGESWTKLESGVQTTLYDVFFVDGRNGHAVGENGTAIQTSNSGEEWEAVEFESSMQTNLLKTNLHGVFCMSTDGPCFITGDKGLYMEMDGEGQWTAKALVCSSHNQVCIAEDFAAKANSLMLLGCRFRDIGNGVIIGNLGSEGVVIVANSSAGQEDKTFMLQKPVKVGNQFPSYFGISMDTMGDVVVSGTLGVVLKMASRSRLEDDGVNWEITGAIAPTCSDDTCGKFVDIFTYNAEKSTTKALTATAGSPNLYTSSILHQGCKHVAKTTSYECVKNILVTGSNSYVRMFDGEDSKWRAAGTGLPASLHLAGEYMPTSNTIIVADRTGLIYKSDDGGKIFKVKNKDVTGWPATETLTKMFGRNADESSNAFRHLASTWLVFAALLATLSAHA